MAERAPERVPAETEAKLLVSLRRNVQRALRAGRQEEAASALERLRERAPLSLETRAMELEWLIANRRFVEARALAAALLDQFPASAGVHEQAGRIAYHDRGYELALEHFTECERRHASWRVRRWIGKTLSQLKRLDEAEAVLVALHAVKPEAVVTDLAWVYERMGRPERALVLLDAYLERHPENEFATSQRLRIRSRIAPAADLVAEATALLELGEPLPSAMLLAYVERLLELGEGALARQRIAEHASRLEAREALSLGWICHRHHAFDLAVGLFLRALPGRTDDVKLLNTLEADARRSLRVEEVRDAYGALASRHPRLFGRLRVLGRSG